jgi:hypothetical protein
MLESGSLAAGFIKESRAALATFSESTTAGIGIATEIIAQVQHGCRNSETFASKNDTNIAGKVCFRQSAPVDVRVCGDAACAHRFQHGQFLLKAAAFPNRQMKDGSHGIPNTALRKKWAAAILTHQQGLDLKGRAILTSAPIFSALDSLSVAAKSRGRGVSCIISSKVWLTGTCATANKP